MMTEHWENLNVLTAPLLTWYDLNGRTLPWRSVVTPYRTWVSEIMLQQTRVSAVIPYFERFMAELPDAAALATVPEERLLKLWEGLGYYSRARNLQKAAKVIRERAQELNSPCYEVTREDTEIIRNTCSGIDFSFKNEYYGNTVFSIPFIALYQVMNSSLALKTMEILKEEIPVSAEAVKKGLIETRWQGRMETVLPGVIVDGAHNEDGVARFVETAAHFQKDYPLTLLFSAVDDKDYTDMIRTILDKIQFRHVVVTQVGGYRKVPAEQLAEIFKENGCTSAEVCEDAEEAFRKALSEKGDDGLLFCVGSLYLVGEIKTAILKGIGK